MEREGGQGERLLRYVEKEREIFRYKMLLAYLILRGREGGGAKR